MWHLVLCGLQHSVTQTGLTSRRLFHEAGSIVVTFPDVENYPIVSGHLEHGSLRTALPIVLPWKMEAVLPSGRPV